MSSSDNTFPQSGSLTSDAAPSVFVDDGLLHDRLASSDLLARLLAAAAVARRSDRRVTQKCIRRAAALLGVDLRPEGKGTAERPGLRRGLAPWQAKRLSSYIEDKLDSTIRASDLAGLARLSTSHFFRAFRDTFGESPLDYVMKRRMVRAQELMSKSRVPLSQVALECGMCDQAHFSRTFRRIVGINPMAWRRQLLARGASGEDASKAGIACGGQVARDRRKGIVRSAVRSMDPTVKLNDPIMPP
jgi:AraC family transcriptional regulator